MQTPEIQLEIEYQIKAIIKKRFNYSCKLQQLGGHSGNSVFAIYKGDEVVYIVKVFESERLCRREIESYKFFGENNFPSAKVAFDEHIDEFHYMFMFPLDGTAPSKLIKKNLKNTDYLWKIGYEIGKTMRRLHELGRHDVANVLSPKQVKHAVLVQMDPDVKIDETLIDDFADNPGQFSYILGDPTLHNFVTKDGSLIYIIDAGHYRGKETQVIPRTKRDPNIPFGFPARDYYRFMCRMKNYFKKKKSDKDGTAQNAIEQGFEQAYGDRYEIFTREAEALFKSYWFSKKGLKL